MNRTRSKHSDVDGQSRTESRSRVVGLVARLSTGGGSRPNISAIGGNFARIRSPILVHPG
ncbi:unnamed protein product [Withania somnifera]